MSTSAAPAQWNAVDFMVDFHTRHKRLGLLTETLAWVASVPLFRGTERQTPYLNQLYSEDHRQHGTLLAALVAEGRRLLRRAHDAGGLPKNLDGINTADLEA